MELEQIIQELNKRLSEPLPEFYHRHLIFWYDEEGDFADQFHDMELEGAKTVKLSETKDSITPQAVCQMINQSFESSFGYKDLFYDVEPICLEP